MDTNAKNVAESLQVKSRNEPATTVHSIERSNDLSQLELLKLANLMDAQDYRKIGLALGISEAALCRYEHDKGSIEKASYHMLSDWLKNAPLASARESLAEKIREVQLVNLANYLETGLAVELSSPLSESLLKGCRKDLESYYRSGICLIQPDPLDFDTLYEFDDIFTNLKLLGEKKNTKRKIPLEYKNLLSTKVNGIVPKRLLVQGEGGSGKTTLCAKIAWDWVERKAFQQFKLVLVVPLRDAKHKSVGQIVKGYLSSSNPVEPRQIDMYIETNPDDVFVIFDGLDEYDGDFNSSDSIVQIVLNLRLQATTVLVTSRPWRADEIRDVKDLPKKYAFIAVEGFTEENQASYIRRYFAEDTSSGNDLILFMSENDVIAENMLPFPIYTAMLCIMWREYEGERRQAVQKLRTFSQTFQEIVVFLIDHYRSKYGLHKSRQAVFDLLKEISQIALRGLLTRQLTFPESTFSMCQQAMETGCKVGVLTREKRFGLRRNTSNTSTQSTTSTVQFPHKLFQEYLAGTRLASLFTSDRSEYDRLMTEQIIPKLKEHRSLLYFSSATDKNVGLDIISRLTVGMSMEYGKQDVSYHFLVDVAFECQDLAATNALGHILRNTTTQLTIGDNMSTHTVSGYLYIMRCLELRKLVLKRNCGRSVSIDVADFACTSPTLREMTIVRGMHQDFYTVLAEQAGSSQIKCLCLAHLDIQEPSLSRCLAEFSMLSSVVKLDVTGCRIPGNFFKTAASIASSGKVKVTDLAVDDWTLSEWTCSNMNAVFPSLKNVTLIVKGSYLPHTDLPRVSTVTTLHVMPYSDNRGRQHACDFLFKVPKIFPHLIRATINDLRWINDEAESVLHSLSTIQKLKSIRMTRCGSDTGLDSAINDINGQGRISVTVEHGKPREVLSTFLRRLCLLAFIGSYILLPLESKWRNMVRRWF